MRALVFVCLVSVSCTVGDDPADDSKAGAGLGSDTGPSGDGPELGILAKRVCAAGVTTKGVDVSYYNGSVNWTTVKNAGYEFAFIRVSDGNGFHDPKFDAYWAGAKAAGLVS